jgi:hypothetical protein
MLCIWGRDLLFKGATFQMQRLRVMVVTTNQVRISVRDRFRCFAEQLRVSRDIL